MSPMTTSCSRMCALALLTMVIASTGEAGDPTTTWTGPVTGGNWADATWSDGEPTASNVAQIGASSAVILTMSGETCLDLFLGHDGTVGALNMNAGSLVIVRDAIVGDAGGTGIGTFSQLGGTVTMSHLRIARGNYNVSIGSSTTDLCTLTGGSLSMFGGSMAVTTDVNVALGSFITLGGGTFSAGTTTDHHVTVNGGFGFTNPATNVTVQNLTLGSDTAFLLITVGQLGLATMTVEGVLTLDGRFQVDDSNAAEGRYDVATADDIQGEFDVIDLPNASWSWGIDGSILYIAKSSTPVQTTTWGGLTQGN